MYTFVTLGFNCFVFYLKTDYIHIHNIYAYICVHIYIIYIRTYIHT